VAIARAMVHSPVLLLADEPTANIDLRAAEEILRLFDTIHLRGTTILFATHDEGLTAALPKERVVLDGGRIVESSLEPYQPSGSGPDPLNSPQEEGEGQPHDLMGDLNRE